MKIHKLKIIGYYNSFAICGYIKGLDLSDVSQVITRYSKKVTCKKCLKIMNKEK